MRASPLKRTPRLEFLCALIVAAIGELLEKWRGIRAALKTKAEVSEELAGLRMAVCEDCKIFFHPLRTCGSPLPGGARDIANGQMLGCACHMPHKARTEANCFMYERDRGQSLIGWPESLNSFKIEDDE